MMHAGHDVRLPEYVGDLVEARRDNLPTIMIFVIIIIIIVVVIIIIIIVIFIFIIFIIQLQSFGVGEISTDAGLGIPAADTCKPHEVPGKPCALTALTGIFTLSVHPQKKRKKGKSGFQNPTCDLLQQQMTTTISITLYTT